MFRRLIPWLVLTTACASPPPVERPEPVSPTSTAPTTAVPVAVELVETVPVGTSLGFDDVPDTKETWLSMIEGAEHEVLVGHFYATEGDGLEEVLAALEDAQRRGVRVRVLLDALFAKDNADTYARIGNSLDLRRTEYWKPRGGIQHAKYMVVDGDDAYLGSANLDWRSLAHIHELGLRLHGYPAAALAALFEADWRAAAGDPPDFTAIRPFTSTDVEGGGELVLVGSPNGALPSREAWELPRLVAAIAAAEQAIEVQLLDYAATFRNDDPFVTLHEALLAAAARGVEVRLLLSDWQKRHLEDVRTLQRADHVTVKLVTIPPAAVGFIPFARVIHAKYAVFDGTDAWLGSSNWKGDYFHNGRNVGAWLTRTPVGAKLRRSFEQVWNSPYAETLDPEADYALPRVK